MCEFCGLDENSFFYKLIESLKIKIKLQEDKVGTIALMIPPRLAKPSKRLIRDGIGSTVTYLKQKLPLNKIDTDDIIENKMTPEYIAELLIQMTISTTKIFVELKQPTRHDIGSKKIYFKILYKILTLFLDNTAEKQISPKEFENQMKEIESIIYLYTCEANGTA